MSQGTYGGQRTTCANPFFPSTIWVLCPAGSTVSFPFIKWNQDIRPGLLPSLTHVSFQSTLQQTSSLDLDSATPLTVQSLSKNFNLSVCPFPAHSGATGKCASLSWQKCLHGSCLNCKSEKAMQAKLIRNQYFQRCLVTCGVQESMGNWKRKVKSTEKLLGPNGPRSGVQLEHVSGCTTVRLLLVSPP